MNVETAARHFMRAVMVRREEMARQVMPHELPREPLEPLHVARNTKGLHKNNFRVGKARGGRPNMELPESVAEDIRTRARAGQTIMEISAATKVSRRVVTRYGKGLWRKKGKPKDAELRARVWAYVQQNPGLRVEQYARAIPCSPGVVSSTMKANGMVLTKGPKPRMSRNN